MHISDWFWREYGENWLTTGLELWQALSVDISQANRPFYWTSDARWSHKTWHLFYLHFSLANQEALPLLWLLSQPWKGKVFFDWTGCRNLPTHWKTWRLAAWVKFNSQTQWINCHRYIMPWQNMSSNRGTNYWLSSQKLPLKMHAKSHGTKGRLCSVKCAAN